MKALTPKQSQILDFIADWLKENGFPPSQAEIRDHFKFHSLNTVRNHLSLIEKKGYLRLLPGQARGIQLPVSRPTGNSRGESFIPLVGHIAAGTPILAEQNVEEQIPVSPSLFGNGEMFALTVVGDSMINAGILHGDRAVIRRQLRVENGEIAAVLIGEEATLKQVFLSSKGLRLRAENPEYEDMVFKPSGDQIPQILGLYKGVIRAQPGRRHT